MPLGNILCCLNERMAKGLMLESIPLVHSMIANDGSVAVAAMRSVGRR